MSNRGASCREIPPKRGRNFRKALSYTNPPYVEMTQGGSFARGCDNVIPGSLFTVNYHLGNILSIDAPGLYIQPDFPTGTGKNGEFQDFGQKIRTSGQFFLKRAEKFIIINMYDLKTKIRDFLL